MIYCLVLAIFRGSNGYTTVCNCFVDARPYTHYAIRSFPLCGGKVLHPTYDLTQPTSRFPEYPSCLAHVVSTMSYIIVANRLKPDNYFIIQVFLEREGGWRPCIHFMHGRSRMTIDPRIPAMPERSMTGVHRPGRHCLHQARNAVRCSASRMEGELYPTTLRITCEADFGALRVV